MAHPEVVIYDCKLFIRLSTADVLNVLLLSIIVKFFLRRKRKSFSVVAATEEEVEDRVMRQKSKLFLHLIAAKERERKENEKERLKK